MAAVVLTAAGLIFEAERATNPAFSTFGDAIYFAITTLTTVGFGDLVPTTEIGRLIVAGEMLAAVTFIAVRGHAALWRARRREGRAAAGAAADDEGASRGAAGAARRGVGERQGVRREAPRAIALDDLWHGGRRRVAPFQLRRRAQNDQARDSVIFESLSSRRRRPRRGTTISAPQVTPSSSVLSRALSVAVPFGGAYLR